MEAFYSIEPGSYIKKAGESLKVMKDRRVIAEIPASGLKRLILSGYTSLSGGVLDYLIQKRIETVFITPTGRFRARLMIDEHKHVALRQAQYIKLGEPVFAADVMRRIVSGKIRNMAAFLHRRGTADSNDELLKASAMIKIFIARLERQTDPEVIRGMEGAATRIYFSVFGLLLKNKDFKFNGRNRRPPKDPVNSLLSFVYTMLTNEVLSAIKTCGLDPYMGALHEIAYGRPSLACDLVEEYRCPLGDRLVLSLINRKVVSPSDFIVKSPGPVPEALTGEEEMIRTRPVVMKPRTCRALIASYESMMNRRFYSAQEKSQLTYRGFIGRQVRNFAAMLTDGHEYKPFYFN